MSELARFKVLMFMLMNISVFCVMTWCRWVWKYQNCRGICYIHLNGSPRVTLWTSLNQEATTFSRMSVLICQSTQFQVVEDGNLQVKFQFQIYGSEPNVNRLLPLLQNFPNVIGHRILSGLKYVGRTQKGSGNLKFDHQVSSQCVYCRFFNLYCNKNNLDGSVPQLFCLSFHHT